MTRRTPAACACGTSAPDASATAARAARQVPTARPADRRTTSRSRRADERRPRRSARRLSSYAASGGGLGVAEEPAAAQAGDREAGVGHDGRRAPTPTSASRSRQSADAGRSRRRRSRRTASASVQYFVVAWLSDNRAVWSLPEPAVPRKCRIRLRGEIRVGQDAGGVGEPETSSTRCGDRARRLCRPPTIVKCVLVAGQPGQEDHTGLVVVGRCAEKVPRQRHGRVEERRRIGQRRRRPARAMRRPRPPAIGSKMPSRASLCPHTVAARSAAGS